MDVGAAVLERLEIVRRRISRFAFPVVGCVAEEFETLLGGPEERVLADLQRRWSGELAAAC